MCNLHYTLKIIVMVYPNFFINNLIIVSGGLKVVSIKSNIKWSNFFFFSFLTFKNNSYHLTHDNVVIFFLMII